jgi:hypothetical protein
MSDVLSDPIGSFPEPAEIHERIGRHKREIDVLRGLLKPAERASRWRRAEAASTRKAPDLSPALGGKGAADVR